MRLFSQQMPVAAAFLFFQLLVSVAAASTLPPEPHPVASWGRRGTDPGAFFSVMAIATAPDGSVYAADTDGIKKFTSDGEFLLEWGSSGTGDGQFKTPTGLAVGTTGEVYVVEYWGHRVQVFDGNGRFLRKWGAEGRGSGEFSCPDKIAIGPDGDVYVTDANNFRVQKFSPTGQFRTAWGRRGTGPGEFAVPAAIAVGPDGRVYVTDFSGGVQVFESDGRFVARWGDPPSDVPAQRPTSAERPPGTGMLKAGKGEFGGPAPPAARTCASTLEKPGGIAFDAGGTLHVLNRACNRVQWYAPGGDYLGGWQVDDLPEFPMERLSDIAVAASGDVFVGERNGPRIRKFGVGPVHTERIALEFLGTERLRLLDSLIAAPLGVPKSAALPALPEDVKLEWAHRGFEPEPVLVSASWEIDVPASARAASIVTAIDDALGRRLGEAPAQVDVSADSLAAVVHERSGLVVRVENSRRDTGAYRIRLERESTGMQTTGNVDACDLRILEGRLTELAGTWEMLFPALRARRPQLADAILSNRLTDESLLEEVRRVLAPDFPEADRDLVLLAADQWLRPPDAPDRPAPRRHNLDEKWNAIGFRNSDARGLGRYYGSILPSLAARTGQNEWADRAFLLLLDQGWLTDFHASFEGPDVSNEKFVPVLIHGEAYLAANASSALRPSVALRVAMAHETAWSRGRGEEDRERRAKVQEHRRRAIELYREVAPRTQDPALRRAIEERVQTLDRGQSGCIVYMITGEC